MGGDLHRFGSNIMPQSEEVLLGDEGAGIGDEPVPRVGASPGHLVRVDKQYELDAQCRLTRCLHLDLQSAAKFPRRPRLPEDVLVV